MNMMLFFTLFAALTLFYTILGIAASRSIETTEDYFLAGRNLSAWPVTLTLVATQIGGAMLLGTSENAYLYGFYGLLYTVGMAGGFLALASGIASRLQALNVPTTAAIFEKKYGSPLLKKIASALSIITLWGILIGQVVGSRSIIDTLAVPFSTEYIFLGFWFFIIFYTMIGGLKAVVITDVFQVLFIIGIFASIFGYALMFGPPFDWSNLADLQANNFGTMPISLNMIVATLLMPALFSLIEQDLAQRFFAARSARVAAISAFLSCGLILFFALIPIYFGMQAKLLGIMVAPGASPLLPVIEYLTNDFMVMLSLCAIIAAITSTADSLLCAISSNLAQDFEFSFFGSNNALDRSKYITLLVGILALGASYLVPQNVITIMIDSYTISVSCLLVPLLWAYFSRSVSRQAAFVSVIAGALGIFILPFLQTDLPKALLPLLLSFIGYVVALIFS